MAVTIELHYGLPEDWVEKASSYMPVSPERIDGHARKGWTVYELEELAFYGIPPEFPDAQIEIGKRLQRLGENAILHAYGPIEGDFLIEVPRSERG